MAGERAIDTVVWQLLASVIIPGKPSFIIQEHLTLFAGYTIHTVVAFVHFLLISGLHLDDPNVVYFYVLLALIFVYFTDVVACDF